MDQHIIRLATEGKQDVLEQLAADGYDYINVVNMKGKSIRKLAKKADETDVVKFLGKLPDFQVTKYNLYIIAVKI